MKCFSAPVADTLPIIFKTCMYHPIIRRCNSLPEVQLSVLIQFLHIQGGYMDPIPLGNRVSNRNHKSCGIGVNKRQIQIVRLTAFSWKIICKSNGFGRLMPWFSWVPKGCNEKPRRLVSGGSVMLGVKP